MRDRLKDQTTRATRTFALSASRLAALGSRSAPHLETARGVLHDALRRARDARLAALDCLIIGALGLLTASSAIFFLICAFSLPGGEGAQGQDWLSPIVAQPSRTRAEGDYPDVQTLTRPLFERSRRPPPAAGNAEAPAPTQAQFAEPPPGLTLKAIVSHGPATLVFLASAGSPDGAWLKVGEIFEGWKVESASKRGVSLKRGDRVAFLEFAYDEGPPPALAAPSNSQIPGFQAPAGFPPPQPFSPGPRAQQSQAPNIAPQPKFPLRTR